MFIAVTLAGLESFRSVAGFVGNFLTEADGLVVRWILVGVYRTNAEVTIGVWMTPLGSPRHVPIWYE